MSDTLFKIIFLSDYPMWARITVLCLLFTAGMILILASPEKKSDAPTVSSVTVESNHGQIFNNSGDVIINEYKSDKDKIRKTVADKTEKINDKKLPGFSLVMFAKLNRNPETRRKYIFATAQHSLFLDEENNLRFSVIDRQNETHSVKVDKNASGLRFDAFNLISCEVGHSSNRSFIRVLVNGEQVALNSMDYDLQLDEYDNGSFVLGANRDGEFGAKFSMDTYVTWPHTFTGYEHKDISLKLLKDGNPEEPISWMEFNGKSFLRVDEAGNLSQKNHDLQPRIWLNGEPSDGMVTTIYNQS